MKVSDTKIQEWLKAGIIGQEQAKQISSYEANHNKNWVVIGFVILASVVIGLGCISLVAFNWEKIPDLVKLGIDFLGLAALAIAAVYYWQPQAIKFDLLSLIFIILCAASIGLIAQIYNLSSPPYQPLLLWSAMTSLVVAYSYRTFTWWLWLGMFLSGIYLFLADKYSASADGAGIVLAMFYFMVALILSFRNNIKNIALYIATRIWIISLLLVYLLLIELIGNTRIDSNINIILLSNIGFVLALLALLLRSELNVIQKIITAIIMTLLLMHFFLVIGNLDFIFMHALFTCMTLICCAILAATDGHRRLFNFFIVLLGIRAVIFYCEALGGMATSGVSLIILGVLILYCTFLWRRHGATLLQNIERWTNAAK